MKELDLIFEKFLSRDFDGLSDDEVGELDALLESQDQDILAWLSGGQVAPAALLEIVRRIQSCLE